ncbi:hypothetical protein A2U01_0086982, partial [Trifolium medium]|nr:hypothetical protein [Trifolium medium]
MVSFAKILAPILVNEMRKGKAKSNGDDEDDDEDDEDD